MRPRLFTVLAIACLLLVQVESGLAQSKPVPRVIVVGVNGMEWDLIRPLIMKGDMPNLLLNFPLPSSGELDFEEMETLNGITKWMEVNSEGIYSSRPWKIYGEGPSTEVAIKAGNFNEDKRHDFTAEDVRFTTKGNTLYAFVQGCPKDEAVVKALGLASPQQPGKIQKVEVLGYNGNVTWKQEDAALKVQMPAEKLSDIGLTLKVQLS